MIVVDVNLIIPLFMDRPNTSLARRIADADPDWRLPGIWRAEFLNVLSNYCKFMGVPRQTTRDIWINVHRLRILREEAVDHSLALELSIEKRISGYDALYVALAMKLRCPLVTLDRKLQKALPGDAMAPEEYLRSHA